MNGHARTWLTFFPEGDVHVRATEGVVFAHLAPSVLCLRPLRDARTRNTEGEPSTRNTSPLGKKVSQVRAHRSPKVLGVARGTEGECTRVAKLCLPCTMYSLYKAL